MKYVYVVFSEEVLGDHWLLLAAYDSEQAAIAHVKELRESTESWATRYSFQRLALHNIHTRETALRAAFVAVGGQL